MKKRLLAALLILCVALSAFAVCGCSFGGMGGTEKYEYERTMMWMTVDEYPNFGKTLDFVYEDTVLKIKDDGTWVIDFNIILFINSKIDKGTYTQNGDEYIMEGFEYGMDTIGRKNGDTFAIDFYIPAPAGDEKLCTLYFEKD